MINLVRYRRTIDLQRQRVLLPVRTLLIQLALIVSLSVAFRTNHHRHHGHVTSPAAAITATNAFVLRDNDKYKNYSKRNGLVGTVHSSLQGKRKTGGSLLFLTAIDDNVSKDDDNNNHYYQIHIEYCPGCRWGLRAFWMAQELLTTFADDSIQAITLQPSRPPAEGGRFVIQLYTTRKDGTSSGDEATAPLLLWDRYDQGRFPELKEIKQLIRDQINPNIYLGHSDSKDRQIKKDSAIDTISDHKMKSPTTEKEELVVKIPTIHGSVSPNISILYCTGCRWLLRSAYYCQELLLSTFENEINSIALIPSRPPAPGGSFMIQLDSTMLWDRALEGRFPEIKELKKLVRDQINPTKDLGHVDGPRATDDSDVLIDGIDDEAADAARKFFGVM